MIRGLISILLQTFPVLVFALIGASLTGALIQKLQVSLRVAPELLPVRPSRSLD